MKDRTAFWWAFNQEHRLIFYGTGDSPAEYHDGHSTPVVRAKYLKDGDTIAIQTKSGSLYAVRRSRMFPNIQSAILLTRLTGR